MPLTVLPPSTVKLVTTTQVITSVSTVVKELVENALDANASNIEVRLDRNGLDKIEVRDDGSGISRNDIENVCYPSTTSKIREYSDIANLGTYGFRGEALSSLCHVSDLTITTKTASDNLAMTYSINHDGTILNSRPCHFGKGTQVVATNLFKNLPVRRQYLSNSRNASEDLRKTENIVKSLAIINPKVRVTFCNNKCSLWQKPTASTMKHSVMHIFGYNVSSRLEELTLSRDEIDFELLIPMKNCDDISAVCHSGVNSIMVYLNKRPVKYPKIEKIITKSVKQHFGAKFPVRKHPFSVVSVTTPPNLLDVNLEPNKTKVLCKDEDSLLTVIEEILVDYYGPKEEHYHENNKNQVSCTGSKKIRLQPECNEVKPNKRSKLDDQIPVTENDPIAINIEHEQSENIVTANGTNLSESVMTEMTVASDKFGKMVSHPVLDCQKQFNGQEIFPEAVKISDPNEGIKPTDFRHNVGVGSEPLSADTVFINSVEQKEQYHNTVACTEIPFSSKVQEVHASETNSITGMDLNEGHCDVSPAPPYDVNHCALMDDLDDVLFGFDTQEQVASQEEKNKVKLALETVKEVNSHDKAVDASAGSVSKENWSKGLVKTKTGDPVQGAALLLPKVSKSKKDFFNLSLHSVSSQMGCKEQSAFTKFSRQMRPKILEENPGIAFTKVAGLLVEHWRNLNDEEKLKFETMAQEDEEERKKMSTPKSGVPQTTSTIDRRKNPPPSKKLQQEDVHHVEGTLLCSLELINNKMQDLHQKNKGITNEADILLIGQIRPQGVWLYKKNNELGIIKHWALQEVVEFHRMMSESLVPVTPVMNRIPVEQSALGPDLWSIFISLEQSFDVTSGEVVISSPFISKNGFRIIITEEPSEISAFITHVATVIRFYGVNELKEILLLLKQKGTDCTIEHCRPLKVVHYFKGEAVAICRRSPPVMDQNELMKCMRYWHTNIQQKSADCLHNKPIFVPFSSLDNL